MTTYPVMNPLANQQDNVPQGVLSAEPPVRALADAGITAAVNALALAAPALSSEGIAWMDLRDGPTDLRDAVNDWVEATQRAKTGNPDLNAGAKWRRAVAIAQEFRTTAEGILQEFTNAEQTLQRRYEGQLRPPAPSSDTTALEAMLGNARLDARMTLDHADDLDLADRLAELATDGGDALQYLILGTNWPQTFFRARGAVEAPLQWERRRLQVLAEVLDSRAVKALPKMAALAHVRRAGNALRGAFQLTVANNERLFAGE